MKTILSVAILGLIGGTLIASESDDVKAAAKKLGDNYSWHTTVAVPEGGNNRFRPGPTDGKIDKSGYILLTMTRGDNTSSAVIKGDKAAAQMEGEWKSLEELSADGGQPGPGMFLTRILRGYKAPAAQVAEIADKTKELKKDGDAISGDLTEDGAKALLMPGGRGGQGATTSKASGSIKFWIKDGALAKFEYKVSGTVSFNGQDRDIERTTTVEIKNVGATKVEVPEEAKKKLS